MHAGVFRWNVFRQITVLNLPTVSPIVSENYLLYLKLLPLNWQSDTSSFVPILLATMVRWSVATGRIRNAFILVITFTPWTTLESSLPSITVVPMTFP